MRALFKVGTVAGSPQAFQKKYRDYVVEYISGRSRLDVPLVMADFRPDSTGGIGELKGKQQLETTGCDG